VSSGGNECTRSSRRGAGLASSSLGGTLDSDGPQGHAVVTQKRKLRTPVWARLRNINISDPHLQIRSRIRSRRTRDHILSLSVAPIAHPLNLVRCLCPVPSMLFVVPLCWMIDSCSRILRGETFPNEDERQTRTSSVRAWNSPKYFKYGTKEHADCIIRQLNNLRDWYNSYNRINY